MNNDKSAQEWLQEQAGMFKSEPSTHPYSINVKVTYNGKSTWLHIDSDRFGQWGYSFMSPKHGNWVAVKGDYWDLRMCAGNAVMVLCDHFVRPTEYGPTVSNAIKDQIDKAVVEMHDLELTKMYGG